jgi:hypothetical protein
VRAIASSTVSPGWVEQRMMRSSKALGSWQGCPWIRSAAVPTSLGNSPRHHQEHVAPWLVCHRLACVVRPLGFRPYKRCLVGVHHMPEQMPMARGEAFFSVLPERFSPDDAVTPWKEFRAHRADVICPALGDEKPKTSSRRKPFRASANPERQDGRELAVGERRQHRDQPRRLGEFTQKKENNSVG